MLGCKVFLTYKRKRLISNGHAHRNECQNSVSVTKETPLCGSNSYDKLIDKRLSEDDAGNSLSSRLEVKKDIEEFGEGNSDKDIVGPSSMDNGLQNKSRHPQKNSYSSVDGGDILGNNELVEKRLATYSRGTSAGTTTDCIGQKPPFKIKISFESHNTLSMLKASSMEMSDSLSKDKPTVSCCDSAEKTKSRAPLLTFIRRCKRKRNTDVTDIQSKSQLDNTRFSTVTEGSKVACDNTFSCKSAPEKGGSISDAMNLKPPDDTSNLVHQVENIIPEVGSTCAYAKTALDTKELTLEPQSVSKDVLNEDEKVLDQTNQIAADVQQDLSPNGLGISLNNAVNDSSSYDRGVIAGKQPAKVQESEREESLAMLNDGPKVALEGSRPFLDLSITPTDSSGTVEYNAYLESNSRKQSVHAITETLLGSMDSTSRSRAAVSYRTSLPELLDIGNERLGESSSTHNPHLCPDASAFLEGPSTSCKDKDKAPLLPLDFMSRNKCLQLFAEERAEESFRSVFAQPEMTNSVKRKSPPFLGIALPTRPKTTGFACNSSFTTFPFSTSFDETRQPFEDVLPQSSSSQLSSLLRHKSVLDGIVNQAKTLSERDMVHDKLKLYTSVWTEEELDSLWVGVRRYGRNNWNAMIRDPRLRFSSWRVARDLAEQWEEEQSKLLQSTVPPLFQHSTEKGFNNFSTVTGNWRETGAEETRLSLGDVYTRRERRVSRRAKFKSTNMRKSDTGYLHGTGKNPYLDYKGERHRDEAFNCFKSKTTPKNNPSSTNCPATFMAENGNLPHWLKDAVFSSPSNRTEVPLALAATSIGHSHPMQATWPYFDQHELHLGRGKEIHHMSGGLRQNDLQTSNGGHHHVADVIVIDSDASSEETISDDHCSRP